MRSHAFWVGCALVWLAGGLAAQGRPLDHDAYDEWRTIEAEALSPDGDWLRYELVPRVGDGTLHVHSAAGRAEHVVDRGDDAAFTPGGGWVVFLIRPQHDSVRAARLEERSPSGMPKDSLGLLELSGGTVERIPAVKSFAVPDEGAARVAYLLEPPPLEEDEEAPRGARNTLVIRDLEADAEHRFENVTGYLFSDDGSRLAYTRSAPDSALDGVYLVDTATGEARTVLTGPGSYGDLAFSEDGERLAFLTDRDDRAAETPTHALYVSEGEAARLVAAAGTPGVPEGWVVSEHETPSFSRSGGRVFFETQPEPEPEPEQGLKDERVVIDVWHWRDPLLQTVQLERLEEERRRGYRAVAHLEDGDRVVQLATEAVPEVEVGRHGDADVGIAETGVPYRHLVGIDAPGWSDVYLVDVRDGSMERVVEQAQLAGVQLSPEARYAAWYDYGRRAWFAMATAARRPVNLTAAIPHPVHDELDDHPMPPGPYGAAGWTDGDEAFLVYDRFDVWATDPAGGAPQNVTEGMGRAEELELRVVDLDPDADAIDPGEPVLLAAFDVGTKVGGFYRDRVDGSRQPRRLVLAEKRFSRPSKAEDADVLLWTREDVTEFPDLWVSDLDFQDARKLSDANPQQAEYNWASVELVEWVSADGIPLQGLLYHPEDFDPAGTYPLMVNFYERDSDNLYRHYPPLPHRSVIRPTFYASRGYVVFMPDIVYKEGYPGESAFNAVVPGVTTLLDQRPYLDADNIGVQGHSWGGYQIAYLVTRTNIFKAAEAGAPVANMTSAYGGIRWGSGMSRMFQYERTQSRIGASLWEEPQRYIENSPLFALDRVETPLLIMHNTEDHAVPFEQGIELFVGLRRLGKPVWMIDYNEGLHWPITPATRRDWNIRMQQFFDHFLKGAPAPPWLEEGIPAMRKGRDLGY